MDRIYLDHTATTPLDASVLEAMMPYLTTTFGNPSSVHFYGRVARTALERARATIASALGADSSEILFTSGGTESDNLAIRGVMGAARHRARTHLITANAEHHAVLDACTSLTRDGIVPTVLPVDSHATVRANQVVGALQGATALVSIMHANNEVGTINPVRDIARAVRGSGATLHTDAVQTVGKIPLSVQDLDVDLLTCTAHKLYGPKGVGVLYVRRGVDLEPLFQGGGQERGRRPGTENVALAVGCAKAIELAVGSLAEESRRLSALRDQLEAELVARVPGVIVNGRDAPRLPHILSVSFDSGVMSLEGEMLVPGLDLEGIAVSSGSACTSGSIQPSHVLLAMGRDPETAKASVRFSFGRSNTEEDIERVVRALERVLQRARKA